LLARETQLKAKCDKRRLIFYFVTPVLADRYLVVTLTVDAELLRGLKIGNRAAFDTVYETYRSMLFAFLVRLTKEQAIAEDLLQETWIRLTIHAPRLTDDTNVRVWLFTVARNLARSHFRWRMFDLTKTNWFGTTQPSATEISPFELTAANQLERELENIIAQLPEKYREILLLSVLHQLPPTEIEAILGLKPPAFRQRLARARDMLKQSLHERGLLTDPTQEQSHGTRS
jgi:RNA polymerase sigma factor (sigma-70 family)